MINIDLENEVFKINVDGINILSVELQFIIAFFSCLLFNRGYSQEEVVVWLSDIEQRGIIKGYQTFKEREEYKTQASFEKIRGPNQSM